MEPIQCKSSVSAFHRIWPDCVTLCQGQVCLRWLYATLKQYMLAKQRLNIVWLRPFKAMSRVRPKITRLSYAINRIGGAMSNESASHSSGVWYHKRMVKKLLGIAKVTCGWVWITSPIKKLCVISRGEPE